MRSKTALIAAAASTADPAVLPTPANLAIVAILAIAQRIPNQSPNSGHSLIAGVGSAGASSRAADADWCGLSETSIGRLIYL
jgi:hypothetical protein